MTNYINKVWEKKNDFFDFFVVGFKKICIFALYYVQKIIINLINN